MGRRAGEVRNWRVIVALLVVAMGIRSLTIMHPHSGEGKPPMHGDFEAQRHWMEITTALPLREWYRDGPENDLQYWGLDYPPLTAYHSYLIGAVGHKTIPEAFALHSSRGYESYSLKVFMKLSVIFSELLVYFPGAYYAVTGVAHVKLEHNRHQWIALAMLWLHPGVLLIDHGHFQYNAVCLGLTLFAIGAVARHKWWLGSVFFVLAVFFKQIALYYAPAFFFGILALCLQSRGGVGNVLATGVVVVAATAVVFSPWIIEQDWDGILQVAHRMFPFSRGLYEDKVANVWCSVSPVLKLNRLFEREVVLRISAGCTFLSLLPGCLCCFRRKYGNGTWVAAVVISATSFFLFSFQVHEKSILFPAVAAVLLPVASPPGVAMNLTRAVAIITYVALFSMYPLVVKDGTHVLYVCLSLVTIVFVEFACATTPVWRRGWRCVLLSTTAVHLVHFTFSPPSSHPDLWTMLFCWV
eukprot:gene10113-15547_t